MKAVKCKGRTEIAVWSTIPWVINFIKWISFALFNCIQNKIEVGIDVERACPYDNFKAAIKKNHPPRKYSAANSEINLGDS